MAGEIPFGGAANEALDEDTSPERAARVAG